MSEERKIAAILVADIVGFSRMAGADEERTLARLRALRRDLIDPTIALHKGRLVKRTGDGAIVEFRSVVEAVRSAIDVQTGLSQRNVDVPADQRIEVRVGIHLGDVVEEADGDLMGDGVNVAARLQAICESGGICLSEDAYRQVRDKIDAAFVDLGEQNLKNIVHPIRAYALAGPASATPASADWRMRSAAAGAGLVTVLENIGRAIGVCGVKGGREESRDHKLRRRRLLRVIITVAVVATVAGRAWRGQEPPAPQTSPPPVAALDEKIAHAPRLSIVVLPFANLSGDPDQDYFTEGLTDDLTTDLSHLPGSFVIGRSTAAAYKGKPADLQRLGRDLGVRYAVEGSVRRVGDTIAINAQLVSTETGAHVWADRFEGDRSKLGELQVDVVARIANALGVQLVQAENLRAVRERPASPDATDLVMRGEVVFHGGFTPENINKAIGYFDQALGMDPNNPHALSGKAEAQVVGFMALGIGRWPGVMDDAEAAVDRALAEEPNSAHAHLVKALISKGRRRYDAWLAEANAAIAIDRNLAPAYAEKGHYMITRGRAAEAVDLVEQALRLDPNDSGRDIWQWYACNARAHLGQWEQAVEWCQKSASTNPALFWPYYELAASYAWLGRQEEAADAIRELQKLRPGATIQLYRALQDFPDPTFVKERDRIVEGLRKAHLTNG